MQVYLAVQNITTNESSKISTFKRALKKAKKINDELRLRKAMTDAGKELPPDAEELPKVPMVRLTSTGGGCQTNSVLILTRPWCATLC